MKLINDDNIVIFLGKNYLNNIDITDKVKIETSVLALINKIKTKYNLDFSGYYNADLYKDDNYGIIISIKKEQLEYLEYFNNQLELNVEVIEDAFLYKVEDIFKINPQLLKKFIIYKIKDNIYLKAKDKISNIELGMILENSTIIYGREARNIIYKSKIVKV
jgi:hypothetical protein